MSPRGQLPILSQFSIATCVHSACVCVWRGIISSTSANMSDWTSTLSYAATDFPPDSDDDSLEDDDSLVSSAILLMLGSKLKVVDEQDLIMAQVDESSVTFTETPL